MAIRQGFGAAAFVIGCLLSAGCTAFNGLEASNTTDGGASSNGETATTFGAEGNVATTGDALPSDSAVAARDGGSTEATPTSTDAPSTGSTGSTGSTAAADAATVGTYLDKLGSAGPKGSLRTEIIDAVVRACDAFGPPAGGGWQRNYCWAHLAGEMLKESSYNPASSVTDSYATRSVGGQTANDPTVGLLQIRFSSVVHDFVAEGPLDRLASVGCTVPSSITSHASESPSSSYWAVTGPSANRSFVESVACNIGFGAWYVYLNATGNGKSSGATYLSDYCAGGGTAANLVTGLRTFLEGPTAVHGVLGSMSAVQSNDGDGYGYVNAIKTSFDAMIGSVSGTHPFFLSLAPATARYCR